MIPLARELERGGHSVTVATSASFAHRLAEHGIDARPFDPDWTIGPGDPVYDRTVGAQTRAASTFFGFVRVPNRPSVEQLLKLARYVRAETIVRDYSEFTDWVVARGLGVPLVTHGIMHRLAPPVEDGLVPLRQAAAHETSRTWRGHPVQQAVNVPHYLAPRESTCVPTEREPPIGSRSWPRIGRSVERISAR